MHLLELDMDSTFGTFVLIFMNLNGLTWQLWTEAGFPTEISMTQRLFKLVTRKTTAAFFFKCVAKRGELEKNVIQGMKYAFAVDDINGSYIENMTKDEIFVEADKIFNNYWNKHMSDGATCDFGGVAALAYVNKTIEYDDDSIMDDYYIIRTQQEQILQTTGFLILGLAFGALIGCCAAMRLNKNFNREVHNMQALRPISKSAIFRKSFGEPMEYYEVVRG
mmetsp:Transcript_26226/g.40212  ORF Transcript_26226/g.40212 Transcript_26226/m.40212 type:complete len:221 (+) Transcript_26226:799-1461(+)